MLLEKSSILFSLSKEAPAWEKDSQIVLLRDHYCFSNLKSNLLQTGMRREGKQGGNLVVGGKRDQQVPWTCFWLSASEKVNKAGLWWGCLVF